MSIEDPTKSIPIAENGTDTKITKESHEILKKNWFDYFEQPYPSSIQQFIDSTQSHKVERERILNDVVSDVTENRNEIENLLSKHPEYKISIYSEKKGELPTEGSVLSKINGTMKLIMGQINELEGFYISGNSEFSSITDVDNIIRKALISFVEYVNSTKTQWEGDADRPFRQNDQYIYADDVLLKGGLKILDKFVNDYPNVDVFYTAPRSALYPAQIIKGSLEYLSKKSESVKVPYFAFPKSKVFVNLLQPRVAEDIPSENHELKELLVQYLISPTSEIRENIKLQLKGDEYKTDMMIRVVDELKDLVEKIKSRGKNDIVIGVFDESGNTGVTITSLQKVVEIIAEYEKKTSGVNVRTQHVAKIIDDGSYNAWPAPIKGERMTSKQYEKISISKDPELHNFSIFTSNLAREIFREKFISRWFFDVELLFRIKKTTLFQENENIIYELPLDTWHDVGGTKLKIKDFFLAPWELIKINCYYRLCSLFKNP